MVALVRDKRGTILVQTVVILPLLVLVVFGGFEVWNY
jgi:Flp pilus assembly protein TadG